MVGWVRAGCYKGTRDSREGVSGLPNSEGSPGVFDQIYIVNVRIQKHKIRNTFNRLINSPDSFIEIHCLSKCKLCHQFITPELLILVKI